MIRQNKSSNWNGNLTIDSVIKAWITKLKVEIKLFDIATDYKIHIKF